MNHGYAIYALVELSVHPDRFVPRLIALCDDRESLPDTPIREAAVYSLGRYGPSAKSALPRLQAIVKSDFEEGAIEEHVVTKAIAQISLEDRSGLPS